MTKTNNNVFCIAPWIHMHVDPTGDVQLCCASNWKHDHQKSLGNLEEESPEEIWNNTQYKTVRKNMLAGKAMPEYCKACYDREAGGINQTERQRLNKEFASAFSIVDQTEKDGTLNTLSLKYLDIRFNNLCNLKCRTCGPDWSSSWANELGESKVLKYNKNWQTLLPYLDQIEKVYFAGGEPLMTPEHYDFLSRLIETNKDLELLYTSNFTRLNLGNKHVLDYWKHFRLVNAVASIDHVNDYAAYVRSGSNYDTIKNNFSIISDSGYTNIHTAITCVLSLYNVTKIGSILIQLHKDKMLQNMDQIVFNILVNPDYQMATIMPEHSLKVAIRDIKNGIRYCKKHNLNPQKLLSIEDWLLKNHNYNKSLFEKFVNYNKSLDLIRKTDFKSMYPEYF